MFGVRKLGYKLHELLDITWQQFEFESQAWHLEEEERVKEYHYRNFMITWAPHRDPKHIPKAFDQFRGAAPKVSNEMQDYFNAEMKRFKDAQKGKPTN
ncbi:MAG: hypothetical protein QXT80_03970 [Thermoplasmatales archaeon]